MYVFYLAMILIALGAFACIKGDSSLFNPPTGGGSRIPPEAQTRLNDTVQTITGHKDDYSTYYHKNNVFKLSKVGLVILIAGIFLLILYLYI